MPNVKTDFVTKARMLGLPASAGAPALVETGGRATSATLSVDNYDKYEVCLCNVDVKDVV